MKTNMTKLILTLTALTLGLGAFAQQQQNDPAEDNPLTRRNRTSETNPEDQQEMVAELIQAVVEAQQAVTGEDAAEGGTNQAVDAQSPRPIRGQGTRGTMGSSTNAISLTAFAARQSTNGPAPASQTLRLNFRNAPLSLVLDYLSDAAGFTISANSKVDLKGSVTVWSNRPVDRNEAVQVLHQALGEHNYAATVEGNVLNIYVVDSSNTEIVAGVPNNNDYESIPSTRELVTQIVYVHNVEAAQLISSLQPLMPNGTSMSPNQGANAIVITDTKANIRRMVQLVKALDTASVSASTLEVFPLTYADATTLAQVIQQVFQADSSSSRSSSRFGGFPGFPGFGGDRSRSGSSSSSTPQAGRVAEAKVVAVADDRSNSLVVSASEDQMKMVRQLVQQMDVNVDDITELRVFRLKYADPQETADQLTSLFPDPTQNSSSRDRSRSFGFFGGPPGSGPPGFSRGSSTTTDANSRKILQARVTAVADPRTGSVIVSAARDLMPQIGGIIEELDSDPAKKKKVYVIKVENRDPQEVVEDLQSVIASDTSSGNFGNRSSSQNSGTQLGTRQQNNLRNTGNNRSSSTSSFGSNSGRTGR
jgi:general secretion pathway protein D